MERVWVRGQGDVLIRADAIVMLGLGPEGLRVECSTGRAVRLTESPCSTALQLGLLEAISCAGTGGGRTVVIIPPAEPGSSTWRWECVDTLLDRCRDRGMTVQQPIRFRMVLADLSRSRV